jgi:hypothetical protein
MADSKSRLGVLVALGAAILTVAVVLRMRTAAPEPGTSGEDIPPHERPVVVAPPPPPGELTGPEQARLAELRASSAEARKRISAIDRELVQARAAIVRTHPDALAALARRKAAQQHRAAAGAADAEVVAARAKIAALNKQRAAVRARFRALDAHDSGHGRPGPDGEPTPPVPGCEFCENQDPAPATYAAIAEALTDEDSRILKDMREATAAHVAALKRLESNPDVAAALAEAKAADSDLQSVVQADNKVRELIRERDEWLEKRISLTREQAGILKGRPAPDEAVSDRTETR